MDEKKKNEEMLQPLTLERLAYLAETREMPQELLDYAEQAAREVEAPGFVSRITQNGWKGIAGLVACMLLVLGGIGVAISLNASPAQADRNTEKVEKQEAGTTVVKPVYDGEDNSSVGIKTKEIEDWEKVPEQKEFLPELLIPGYIPEGYEFRRLIIEKYEDGKYKVEYWIESQDQIVPLIIVNHGKEGVESSFIENSVTTVISSKGEVYFSNKKDKRMFYLVQGALSISGYSNMEDAEVVTILEQLK